MVHLPFLLKFLQRRNPSTNLTGRRQPTSGRRRPVLLL